jgi:hypothetical protein
VTRSQFQVVSLAVSMAALLSGCSGTESPAGKPAASQPSAGGATAKNVTKADFDLTMLRGLLGKAPKSPEVDQFLAVVGENPEESSFDSGGIIFYSWQNKGLSLGFYGGKLTIIFLYSEGAEDYHQYQGKLPEGLSFGLTRPDVESKLGKPDPQSDGSINNWADYKDRGLHITYDSDDPKNPAARIFHVGLVPTGDRKIELPGRN